MRIIDNDVIQLFENKTSGMKNMKDYQELLKSSIQEVKGVQEEIGLDSLATSGGTIFRGSDDLGDNSIQLINYLIIE